jgi:hypothetical protein
MEARGVGLDLGCLAAHAQRLQGRIAVLRNEAARHAAAAAAPPGASTGSTDHSASQAWRGGSSAPAPGVCVGGACAGAPPPVVPDFNPGSAAQLAEVLYSRLRLPLPASGNGGEWLVTRMALVCTTTGITSATS